jgi:hypothetical protein
VSYFFLARIQAWRSERKSWALISISKPVKPKLTDKQKEIIQKEINQILEHEKKAKKK